MMMLKNPGRSFGEMGQGKKKSLCGIFLSSFWVFKKKNSLKKNTDCVVIGTNVGVVSPWVIIFNPSDI
jgi:hypothetical protein